MLARRDALHRGRGEHVLLTKGGLIGVSRAHERLRPRRASASLRRTTLNRCLVQGSTASHPAI